MASSRARTRGSLPPMRGERSASAPCAVVKIFDCVARCGFFAAFLLLSQHRSKRVDLGSVRDGGGTHPRRRGRATQQSAGQEALGEQGDVPQLRDARQAQAVGQVGVLVHQRAVLDNLRPRAVPVAARQGAAAPGGGVPPAVLRQQSVPRDMRRARRARVQRVPRRAAQPGPRVRVRPARLEHPRRPRGAADGGDADAPSRGRVDDGGDPEGSEEAKRAAERQEDER